MIVVMDCYLERYTKKSEARTPYSSVSHDCSRHHYLPKWLGFLGREQIAKSIANLKLLQDGTESELQVSHTLPKQLQLVR